MEKEEKERRAMETVNVESKEDKEEKEKEGEDEDEDEEKSAAKRKSPMEREEIPAKRENVETATQKKKMLREKKQDADVQHRTVFVNNLSFAASEEDVQERFQQYGEIVEVTIVRNNHGKSRGFGYVDGEWEDAEESKNGSEKIGSAERTKDGETGKPKHASRCEHHFCEWTA